MIRIERRASLAACPLMPARKGGHLPFGDSEPELRSAWAKST